MNKCTLLAVGFISLTSFQSSANSLAIDIGDDSFNTELTSNHIGQNTQFSVGFISAEDDTKVYSFKGLVTGQLQSNQDFRASLGGKFYYIDADFENIQGFALGGEVSYELPSNRLISFDVNAYIAPSPTLSDDLDYLTDWSITTKYKLLKNGEIYINYRQLKVAPETGSSVKINDGVNVGLNFLF